LPRIRIEKIIKAERQHVFDIVANYENFEKIMPQHFPSIRIRSVRENTAIVEEHLRLGSRELVMMTKHVTKYPELHEVFVIGGDAKGSHFVEKYEKIPEGTKMTAEANIKLGGMLAIAGVLSRNKLSLEFGKIIDEFAKVAERP